MEKIRKEMTPDEFDEYCEEHGIDFCEIAGRGFDEKKIAKNSFRRLYKLKDKLYVIEEVDVSEKSYDEFPYRYILTSNIKEF